MGFLVRVLVNALAIWLATTIVPGIEASSGPTVVAAALILLAVGYKKMFSGSPEGFPGYFTFLVAGAFAPSAGLFASARPLVNWRAFSLTLFMIVLVSLVWEATLAIPYGWWGYEPRQMLGLRVGAWSGLPIEAVCAYDPFTTAETPPTSRQFDEAIAERERVVGAVRRADLAAAKSACLEGLSTLRDAGARPY